MLISLWQDLRHATRGLRDSPAFAATAVLTVAAGIAGPSLIFSLANWTLLRPVPSVVEPDRVGAIATAEFREQSYSPRRVQYADYFDLRRSLKGREELRFSRPFLCPRHCGRLPGMSSSSGSFPDDRS